MKRITIHDIPLPGLSDAGFEIRHRQFTEAFTRPRRHTSFHLTREEDLAKRNTRMNANLGQKLPRPIALVFCRLG